MAQNFAYSPTRSEGLRHLPRAPQALQKLGPPQARENFERFSSPSERRHRSSASAASVEVQHLPESADTSSSTGSQRAELPGRAARPDFRGCCGMLGGGSMPLGMGKDTCDSSAVLRLVDTKIDRRGRWASTDTKGAPVEGERDMTLR